MFEYYRIVLPRPALTSSAFPETIYPVAKAGTKTSAQTDGANGCTYIFLLRYFVHLPTLYVLSMCDVQSALRNIQTLTYKVNLVYSLTILLLHYSPLTFDRVTELKYALVILV